MFNLFQLIDLEFNTKDISSQLMGLQCNETFLMNINQNRQDINYCESLDKMLECQILIVFGLVKYI